MAAEAEWIQTLKQGGAVPLSELQLLSPCWTSCTCNNFFVRGPHFLETKAKVPADEPLLQPIAFDFIKSSSKISRFMQHPKCRVRAALCAARESAKPPASITSGGGSQEPFVWVFNLQLPTKENHSVVMYYVSFHSPEKGSLMQRFLDEDDAFRNDRLKMVASIPQGPRLVKLVLRDRAPLCMIGKALDCTYTREKDYIEVDVDVGSSLLSRTAFQFCCGLAAVLTSEVAFLLEGRCENELPERIVGAVRFSNLDFSSATSVDFPLLSHESVNKDKHEASYKWLWRSLSKLGHQELPANDVDEEKLYDGNSENIL